VIDETKIWEILKLKGYHLYHRESQELEFKEQFSFAGLADYLRDFAAFANNRGGYLVFGVQDSPRIPIGLSNSSLNQFERIDPEKISGFLLEFFSSDIFWEQGIFDTYDKSFGVFRIYEADSKPVIAKKDAGKNQEIRNGDIYYRYGGRTQRIRYAELEGIIASRVEDNNRQWQDLVQKIGQTGPGNAAILDTERSLIEKGDHQILVLDKNLADKLRFVRGDDLSKMEDKTALKLVGDVVPIDHVEVVKRIKDNRLKRYPFSAMELAARVKERISSVKQHQIWQTIKENGLKENPNYSIFNFRNKRQQDEYEETGYVPSGTPSIYNQEALEFIVSVLTED
jgi:hypothetical protein